MSAHAEQVKQLLHAVSHAGTTNGEALCTKVEAVATPLLLWLEYLLAFRVTGSADELLKGCQSAIVESAACVAIGLVRPALFSLRGQIDLLLCWLYFKDHPVEWQYLERTGEGFMLKKDVLKYLDAHIAGFSTRLGILKQCKLRGEEDPYRLLSAHVHSQSSKVVPTLKALADVVMASRTCSEFVDLQAECIEYLNDILLGVYASAWAALPKPLVDAARNRMSPGQEAVVFA